MNYINPFEILKIDNPDIALKDQNILKKAKKRLLAEIELSDNKSIFHDLHEITKSEILRILDDLDDPNLRGFHFFIFQNKYLNKFLSNGNLSFFKTYREESIYKLPEFIKFISPFFASKFNQVFFENFKNSNKYILKLLIKNRKLISNEYEDEIYKDTYNFIKAKINEIDELSKKNYNDEEYFDQEKISELKNTVENIISEVELINFLPKHFQSQTVQFAKSVKNLSINIFNHLDDSKYSIYLLDYVLKLKIDNYTKVKLQNDYEIIKEREETKKYEPALKKYAGVSAEIRKFINEADEGSLNVTQLITRISNLISINKLNQYPDIFDEIRNLLALELRNLSVAVWNNYKEINTSISILKIALDIKVNDETQKYLKNEYNESLKISDEHFRYLENQKREQKKEKFKKIAWAVIAVIVIIYLSTLDGSDNSNSYKSNYKSTNNYYSEKSTDETFSNDELFPKSDYSRKAGYIDYRKHYKLNYDKSKLSEGLLGNLKVSSLNIRSGPGTQFRVKTSENNEKSLLVIGEYGNWYEVVTVINEEAFFGWASKRYIDTYIYDFITENYTPHKVQPEIRKSIPSTPPITLNSNKQDVINAMGKPDEIKKLIQGEIWYYDNSYIKFNKNGRVKEWKNTSKNLSISLGNKIPNAPPIKIKSTRQDVINAMGTPDEIVISIFGEKWKYGYSVIWFNEYGQVKEFSK